MNSKNPVSIPNVALAWEKYLESGEINPNLIKQPIIESWKRCNEARVNPLDGVCQDILEHREWVCTKDKNHELLELATPLMKYYYQIVKGTGVVLVLTDEMGYLLDIFGDNLVLEDAKKINFMPGANWNENQVGTNAIGTSLQIKKPIHTTAAEHYCQKHHYWTCSAAPILDLSGKVKGIINISGPSRTFHRHTLGIAAAIANSITMKSIMQKKGQELFLIDKRFSLLFDNASDGIIEVDVGGTVKRINSVVNILFQKPEATIIGKPFEELLPRDLPPVMTLLRATHLNYECSLPYKGEKRKYVICGEPLMDTSGTMTGGIIIIKQMDENKHKVNSIETHNPGNAKYNLSDIVGNSPVIIEAKQIAQMAAKTASSVLLQGECGTGKEIFAQAIHNESPRKNNPFIAVNCGAIPKELIGSELFGYEEGAFTGAKRGGKIGKFEMASGGTLFFDEIGDMPLEQQVALLRVLQEKRITRIGGNREVPVDTRVICATNKNLLSEVIKGNFRQDLYYRLNVISINIAPLRNRGEDIIQLFNHYLRKYELMVDKSFTVEPEVFDYIRKYHWPGNVRELQNVVERLVTLTQDRKISVSSLPMEICIPKVPLSNNNALQANYVSHPTDRRERKLENAKIEQQKIIYMLDKYHGNVSRAADELGMSRNTLYRKMRLYEINN